MPSLRLPARLTRRPAPTPLVSALDLVGDRLVIRPGPAFAELLSGDLHLDYPAGSGLADLPRSSLLLPAIWLLGPIAWAHDLRVEVEGADASVATALPLLRDGFRRAYPTLPWAGEVIVRDPVPVAPRRPAQVDAGVCFTGGVDSLAAALAHGDERLLLLTVDFAGEKSSPARIARTLENAAAFAAARGHRHAIVRSDLKVVMTKPATLRLRPTIDHWWPAVGHAMGLAGIFAPLLHLGGAERLHIGSTFGHGLQTAWGSSPELDPLIGIGAVRVIHDVSDADRFAKVRRIVADAAIHGPAELRVCYKQVPDDRLNCGDCEKCFRTIAAIVLAGAEPADFGFPDAETGVIAAGPAAWDRFVTISIGGPPGFHFTFMGPYARTVDPDAWPPARAALIRWIAARPEELLERPVRRGKGKRKAARRAEGRPR